MYDCVSDFLCPILPTLEIVWDLHLCVTVMVMLMRGASALQRFPLTGISNEGWQVRNTCQMQSRFLENILVLFYDLKLSTLVLHW